MINSRIDKVCTEITKTKAKMAECQAKLRELEKQKISLENEEIVAMFRREIVSEDELYSLLRSQRKENTKPPVKEKKEAKADETEQ